MTTEKHAWLSAQPVNTSATRTAPEVCSCGQDLEAWTRSHCPRCGSLAVGTGAWAA